MTWLQVQGLCDFTMVKEEVRRLRGIREVRLPKRGVPRSLDGGEERRNKDALVLECAKRGVRVWFGHEEAEL